MKNIVHILFLLLFCSILSPLSAEKFVGTSTKSTTNISGTAAGCADPSGFTFLHVNNVRARINTGGDMWWDLSDFSQYYIPADAATTSMFSGSLWIGGLDVNNQLKLAALRYRQVGQDYWTGPLTIDGTASVDAETCAKYDKHFSISKADVEKFLAWRNSDNPGEEFPDYTIPTSILEYPAHGDPDKNQSFYLAPFMDVDGDGIYNPNSGDYPYYDFDNDLCHSDVPTIETEQGIVFGGLLVDQVLKGDETLWWVFNDKGDFHSETEGDPIGMEIRAQAFGFTTNDEINNMTFYSYEVINRSTYTLTQTYFSPWVDTDLGYAWDDYVGCDVQRGLGYCYNGQEVDGSGEPEAYGAHPPAIGVDFFQGPYMDDDGIDNPKYEITIDPETGDSIQTQICDVSINGVNFGNGIIDDERFGMRRFVFHNNDQSVQGDPDIAPEYYNYLRGIWKDNSKMLYGGNAHSSSGALGPECDFMFPYDSDPCNWGTGGVPPNGGFNQEGYYWNEEVVDNNPNDRRFMQSAGPFTLLPGAVNYITVGIPWARSVSGGPWDSVELLRVVDDKCQALFDNCFKVIDGPTAPDLTFREMNQELIVYISNDELSNNYEEGYKELDPEIAAISPEPGVYDPYYRFEGYQIFQLKNATVGVESLDDPDLARLVAQYDVKNGVGKLVNYYFDESLGGNVPVMEVNGGDNGIVHSFMVSQDKFTNTDLVNFKQYYYMAIAYAYNNYKDYDQTSPDGLDGQKKPYLAGRKNIRVYTAIPHPIINGNILPSQYGTSPEITRLEGKGNGGIALELTDETVKDLLEKDPFDPVTNPFGSPDYPMIYNPVYKQNAGPLDVKIIDPLNVAEGNFIFKLDTLKRFYLDNITGRDIFGDTTSFFAGSWTLINTLTGTEYKSDTSINYRYEQLFPELGFSVAPEQQFAPGPSHVGYRLPPGSSDNENIYSFMASNNGLITSDLVYSGDELWLSGVDDTEVPGDPQNWIVAGSNDGDVGMPNNPSDPESVYEKLINSWFAPYGMTAIWKDGPTSVKNVAGPSIAGAQSRNNAKVRDLFSIDLVITPDQDKWTRCPVVEMANEAELAQGGSDRFHVRNHPSVDKDGNYATPGSGASTDPDDPNYISDVGMGWFPGYAINLETGERLNVIFGEDSYLSDHNGDDMLFNPTSTLYKNNADPYPVFGGRHYIYVFRQGGGLITGAGDTIRVSVPVYDAGKALHRQLTQVDEIDVIDFQRRGLIFGQAVYTGLPMSKDDVDWLANTATVKIRIMRPYESYISQEFDIDTLPSNTPITVENNHFPMYSFSTEGMGAYVTGNEKERDLNQINVVPNPYYAYSQYENNPLDNRIKITNLPQKCTVTIYNVKGTLIRQYKKDDPVTFIEWDLKNHAGIPIAGGVYIIHVDSDEGEQIVKWFGSLRQVDLFTF